MGTVGASAGRVTNRARNGWCSCVASATLPITDADACPPCSRPPPRLRRRGPRPAEPRRRARGRARRDVRRRRRPRRRLQRCARAAQAASPATPWCSLTAAAAKAPSGGTVLVRGGSYPYTIDGSDRTPNAATVTMKPYPGETRCLRGRPPRRDPSALRGPALLGHDEPRLLRQRPHRVRRQRPDERGEHPWLARHPLRGQPLPRRPGLLHRRLERGRRRARDDRHQASRSAATASSA